MLSKKPKEEDDKKPISLYNVNLVGAYLIQILKDTVMHFLLLCHFFDKHED